MSRMRYTSRDIAELSAIVEQLRRDFPHRSLKRTVKDAERVYANRKAPRPTGSEAPPDHVLRNIERIRKAAKERRRQGHTLPQPRPIRAGTGAKLTKAENWPRAHEDESSGARNSVPGDLRSVAHRGGPATVPTWTLPEEVSESEARILTEGALKQVTVNAYERSGDARRACVAHYGARCFVCGFDFEKQYGEAGRGYIHIHHEKPLATIAEEYEVDPVEDLKPVCANCHAIIHRRKPAYTVSEVREMLCKAGNNKEG